MRVGLYARVSTHDQQTLGLQIEAMKAYINPATKRIKESGHLAVRQGKR
jgi:DNA invertase Pin-like site-specific DNA recombinase